MLWRLGKTSQQVENHEAPREWKDGLIDVQKREKSADTPRAQVCTGNQLTLFLHVYVDVS